MGLCENAGMPGQSFFDGEENRVAEATPPVGFSGTTRDIFPHVYTQLRDLAHAKMTREKSGLTLQTTALVHEVYMRLSSDPAVRWENPRHFFAAAAEAMKRILIERARRASARKHGGGRQRQDLDFIDAAAENADADGLIALGEALDELSQFDPTLHEVVMLRYFSGLSVDETAKAMDRSPRSVKYDWAVARAWLLRRIQGG